MAMDGEATVPQTHTFSMHRFAICPQQKAEWLHNSSAIVHVFPAYRKQGLRSRKSATAGGTASLIYVTWAPLPHCSQVIIKDFATWHAKRDTGKHTDTNPPLAHTSVWCKRGDMVQTFSHHSTKQWAETAVVGKDSEATIWIWRYMTDTGVPLSLSLAEIIWSRPSLLLKLLHTQSQRHDMYVCAHALTLNLQTNIVAHL